MEKWETEFKSVCQGDLRTSMETRELVKDFIRETLASEKQRVVETVRTLLKKNMSATCKEHRKPRGIDAQDYICTDLHIGYEEAISDVLVALQGESGE